MPTGDAEDLTGVPEAAADVPGATAEGRSATGAITFGSLRRRLLRGSAWVFLGRVVTIGLGLVMNVLLARLLTHAELGAYFTTFTMVMIGSTIAQLGLDRAVVRMVAAAIATGRPGKARRAIGTVFVFGLLGAVGVSLILGLGLGGWLARHVFHSALVEAVMPLAAGWVVVVALQSLTVESYRGLQRFAAATIFDAMIVDVLLTAVFGVLFVSHSDVSLRGVVAITAGVVALVASVGGILLARRTRKLQGEGTLERGEALAIAWPLLVTSISIYLLGTGIDLLVLGAFRPQSQVALYGAASRLTLLVATPFTILQGVTPPIVAELYAKGQREKLQASMRAVATLAGIPTLLILLVFLLFGRQVMGLLYSPFFGQAAPILAILSIARLVAVWTGSCGVVLMMTGHQRAMMYLTIGTGVVSVGAGILAAPAFGGIGVAVATSAAQVTQNVAQLFLARRLVGVWTQIHLSPRPFIRFFRGRGPAGSESS
ncbi:MAG: oligosaccharide flippase family protein [Actinobacteria bacterium]|nr:oligosaccharide flippase family protein [Actinomycetota bacterium]